MRITECVPLPGQGFVARSGDLLVISDGVASDPDVLLTVLAEVASGGGDGSDLVRRVARAALESDGQPAWACVGPAGDGEVVVLVHGNAVATVSADGGDAVSITAEGAVIPVSRVFAGASITAELSLGAPAAADARLRLDGGIVHGGGARITATAAGVPAGQPSQGGYTKPLEQIQLEKVWRDQAQPDQTQPGQAQPGQAQPDQVAAIQVEPERVKPEKVKPEKVKPEARAPAEPAPVQGFHQPDPNAAFESILFVQPDQTAPAAADPVSQIEEIHADDHDEQSPAMVEGVLCARSHFNDPDVQYCRQCGLSMVQLTRNVQLRPRPPLGVLLMDDGMTFTLDTDYVLGREPVLDADVAAGRARPLRVADPDGTVSRLHLRVALVGWKVQVSDLGSANGSVLYPTSGKESRLKPHEPVIIQPGTKIAIGHRNLRFESYLSH